MLNFDGEILAACPSGRTDGKPVCSCLQRMLDHARGCRGAPQLTIVSVLQKMLPSRFECRSVMAGLCSIIKKLAAWLEENADDITQPNPAKAREPMLEGMGQKEEKC